MKKPKIFQQAFIGMTAVCLFLAISCTSQTAEEDGDLEAAEQSVSEEGGSEVAAEENKDADISDLSAATETPSDAPKTDVDESLAAADGPPKEVPPADGDVPPADKVAASDAPVADPAATDLPPGELPPEGDALSFNEKQTPAAPAEVPPADASAATDASALPPMPGAEKEKSVSTSRAAYNGAQVPRIPEQAVTKGKNLLNRYYFLRAGDTAPKVSELLYGNAQKAKDLKRWNKGAWKPGKLVYYESPAQPQDQSMRSFYEERGLTPDSYTVAKGDWISRIASKKLGSPASWKEIAVINGLSSADAITRGQSLKFYPDLTGGSAAPQQAAQPTRPEMNQNLAQNQTPPGALPPAVDEGSQSSIGAVPPGAEDPNAASAAESQKKKGAKANSGVNMAKVIQQNAFFIVTGLGISGLLLALLAVNKRKRGKRGDDFGEEGFAAAGAKKRR